MKAISVMNLEKSYGANKVLKGVDLEVDEGEFYALMGPNGSGKTTLSSIIASVTDFDAGIIDIYGKKPADARRMIGYVPQDNFSSPLLSARENLMYFAGLLGYSGRAARVLVNDLLEKVGLSGDARKRVARFSGGMRKRLEIATALFPGIKVLILDEPTTGLDPSARRDFFSLLQKIKDKNTSIFLITHIGSDAELANRVGLIDSGKIVAQGTPDDLRRAYATEDVITVELPVKNAEIAGLLKTFSPERPVVDSNGGYRLYSADGGSLIPDIIRRLDLAGYKVSRIELARPSLEDVFYKVTEKNLKEVAA